MIVLKAAQEKVLAALQSVAGIVERRHTLPILANVLIRKNGPELELITSDLEIQIRTTAQLDGDAGSYATTVGAKKLGDILKSLPSDQTVSLTANQNKLTLPEGKSLTLVATDGHRLALSQATLDVEMPKQEVILPRKTVLELQRLLKDDGKGKEGEEQMIEMRFAGNQAKFSFGGLEFVTKLVEGKFPDYNRVIPKNHKHHITLGRAALLASLQRAAILTSDKFKGVRLNFQPGLLGIASSNAEQEEVKEEIEIDYGGDSFEIGFNVGYLMDVLANMSQDMVTVSLQDANSSALITNPEFEGFKYVVMPMRI